MILHGTRSGIRRSIADEFTAVSQYGEYTQYAYNVTGGEDAITIHLAPDRWGWHAYHAAQMYLGYEFANPLEGYEVNDAMVRAFVYWFKYVARARWPELPTVFRTHSEIEREVAGVPQDGKTDCFRYGDPRADDLRARIAAHMEVI